MTGVQNGDGSPVGSFFGMDASHYYNTNAGGSQGASGQADDAVPTMITPPSGAWYDRHGVSTHGSIMPGQDDTSVISPGPAGDYVDTGASDDPDSHTDAWGRFDWQQGRS